MAFKYTQDDVRQLREEATRAGDYHTACMCGLYLGDPLTPHEVSALGDLPWGANMLPENIERTVRGALIIRATEVQATAATLDNIEDADTEEGTW
jgi:hypothetical protein